MKRLLLLLVVGTSLCLSIYADSYRKTLDEFVRLGSTINSEAYEGMLAPLAEQLYPNDIAEATKAISEYMSSQMYDDIAGMYDSIYRKHVTEEELRELITIYSDPRYIQIQQKVLDVANNLEKTEEYKDFINQIQTLAMSLLSNDSLPGDISVSANISDEYKEAFARYYKLSKINESLMASFDFLIKPLAELFEADGEKKIEAMMAYMERNISNVYLSLMNQSGVTIDDLHLLSKVASLPSCQHMANAGVEISGNPIQLSVELFNNMANWMDAKYPKYAAPIRNLLQELRQIFQLLAE
jgi:hypothetical protein